MTTSKAFLVALALSGLPATAAEGAAEFCLRGELDLAARYQGMQPEAEEWYPASWCVITDQDSDRVRFSAAGRSNSDMEGDWTVSFLPPDRVRIVNAGSPPDVEFIGADSLADAHRHRRIDPLLLVQELADHPEWTKAGEDEWTTVRYPGEVTPVHVRVDGGKVKALRTQADLPLRGRVPVTWQWDWTEPGRPRLNLDLDGRPFFRAHGEWRDLDEAEAASVWAASDDATPREVPGDFWPSRIDMQRVELAAGVYLVRTVRSGFQHLVVDTAAGLLVADAPAGWVELHQVPPVDLVPGLGISGLSERFIDFLAAELPGRPLRAVALTHAHDDHAGGARAFAAGGAEIYAPASIAGFLEAALSRDSMPEDRLGRAGGSLTVTPVGDQLTLPDNERPVRLMSLGEGPHSSAALGVYLPAQAVFFQSDLHVPRDESPRPRTDRAATECWFADWAVRNLPPEVKVVNTHSTVETPVARLEQYLDTDTCGDVAE